MFFFFFKQKTAYEMRISDWSSDVCSSDLDEVDSALQQRVDLLAVDVLQFVEPDRAKARVVDVRGQGQCLVGRPDRARDKAGAGVFLRLRVGFRPGDMGGGVVHVGDEIDRKSNRLNSSLSCESRMPSPA